MGSESSKGTGAQAPDVPDSSGQVSGPQPDHAEPSSAPSLVSQPDAAVSRRDLVRRLGLTGAVAAAGIVVAAAPAAADPLVRTQPRRFRLAPPPVTADTPMSAPVSKGYVDEKLASMSVGSLDDLSDVSAAAPKEGDILVYDGPLGMWVARAQKPNGLSPSMAAESASKILEAYPGSPNGMYWIKPAGYSGAAFEVYCDMDGSASGIGSPGWMRISYSVDRYSQNSPWTSSGNSSASDPPYSGDFSFVFSDAQIEALLQDASESRQILESWGYGSVGWTYSGGSYLGCKTWDKALHRGTGTSEGNNLILGSSKPPSISYGFTNIRTFNNSGSDPTDANDAVWRKGTIYLRDTSATKLPVRGVYARDVDASSERRYFPLVSGDGSHTWVR